MPGFFVLPFFVMRGLDPRIHQYRKVFVE